MKFYTKYRTSQVLAGSMIVIGSVLVSLSSNAQVFMNNAGAKMNIASGSYLNIDGTFENQSNADAVNADIENNGTMEVSGSWTNNDAQGVFSTNSGVVRLDGAAQTIGGSSATLFNNLTLLGTGDKTMAVNTTVGGGYASPSGVLSMGSRNLFLGVADDYDLTITNPSNTAITTTTGLIVSENTANPTNSGTAGLGYSYVQWNIGASGSGSTYTVPFGTSGLTNIAFTYNKTSAGAGAGSNMKFATYHSNYQNEPWPTTVTHLTNDAQVANWYDVLDRFWIIEHSGYTTLPTSQYIFKWDETNDLVNGVGANSIVEANLRPQRWNPNNGIGLWGDWLYGPDNINTAANTLQISVANGTDYFSVWTLVDESNPLPIELIRFAGNCGDGKVEVTWTTASETNNDFFTVQRSIDGVSFEDVTIVDGAGNSSSIINYSAVDYNPYGGTSYYRLKQTDFDGTSKYSDVAAVSCGNNVTDFNLVNAYDQGNGTMAVVFNAGDNEPYTVTVYDIIGKQITETTGKAYSGQNQINIAVGDLARGIYMVNLKNEFKSFGRRVMLH